MYKPLPHFLSLRESDIEGFGVFAGINITKGTILGRTHYLNPLYHCICSLFPSLVTPFTYIRTPLGGFYNHSNNPNAAKVWLLDGYKLVALRDISHDEEITVKYTLYTIGSNTSN